MSDERMWGIAFGILFVYTALLCRRGVLRRKALGWLREASTAYGSFMWVCGVLGVPPDHARWVLRTKSEAFLEEVSACLVREYDVPEPDVSWE